MQQIRIFLKGRGGRTAPDFLLHVYISILLCTAGDWHKPALLWSGQKFLIRILRSLSSPINVTQSFRGMSREGTVAFMTLTTVSAKLKPIWELFRPMLKWPRKLFLYTLCINSLFKIYVLPPHPSWILCHRPFIKHFFQSPYLKEVQHCLKKKL